MNLACMWLNGFLGSIWINQVKVIVLMSYSEVYFVDCCDPRNWLLFWELTNKEPAYSLSTWFDYKFQTKDYCNCMSAPNRDMIQNLMFQMIISTDKALEGYDSSGWLLAIINRRGNFVKFACVHILTYSLSLFLLEGCLSREVSGKQFLHLKDQNLSMFFFPCYRCCSQGINIRLLCLFL